MGDNKDISGSWDEHNFDVEGKEGEEWETTKVNKITRKRARKRRRRKEMGGGRKPPLPTIQNKTKQISRRTYHHTPNVSRVYTLKPNILRRRCYF